MTYLEISPRCPHRVPALSSGRGALDDSLVKPDGCEHEKRTSTYCNSTTCPRINGPIVIEHVPKVVIV